MQRRDQLSQRLSGAVGQIMEGSCWTNSVHSQLQGIKAFLSWKCGCLKALLWMPGGQNSNK